MFQDDVQSYFDNLQVQGVATTFDDFMPWGMSLPAVIVDTIVTLSTIQFCCFICLKHAQIKWFQNIFGWKGATDCDVLAHPQRKNL